MSPTEPQRRRGQGREGKRGKEATACFAFCCAALLPFSPFSVPHSDHLRRHAPARTRRSYFEQRATKGSRSVVGAVPVDLALSRRLVERGNNAGGYVQQRQRERLKGVFANDSNLQQRKENEIRVLLFSTPHRHDDDRPLTPRQPPSPPQPPTHPPSRSASPSPYRHSPARPSKSPQPTASSPGDR
jgi:hypothetical protein